MSKATQKWGWAMSSRAWEWPYRPQWLQSLFQSIGNYGLRGAVREKGRGAIFAVRNLLLFRLGFNVVYTFALVWLANRNLLRWRPGQLLYAVGARCEKCGHGLAYPKRAHWISRAVRGTRDYMHMQWTCSALLTMNRRVIDEHPNDHTALHFALYECRSDSQPARSAPTMSRPVLWGLLGYRYATEREVGNTTRPGGRWAAK